MGPLLLILLPALVCCSVDVDILSRDYPTDVHASVRGSYTNKYNDKVAEDFQLSNEILKEAVTTFTGGHVPDKLYLRKPEPPNEDLYKKNGFSEVEHRLEFLNYTTDSAVIKHVVYEERFNGNLTCHVDMYNVPTWQDIHSIETSWTKDRPYENKRQRVNINVDGYTILVASTTFGDDDKMIHAYNVTPTNWFAEPPVALSHGQDALLRVTAETIVLTVTVYFEESLFGNVVCTFQDKLKYPITFYVRGMGIEDILKGMNRTTKFYPKLVITVRFEYNDVITLTDTATNRTLGQVLLGNQVINK